MRNRKDECGAYYDIVVRVRCAVLRADRTVDINGFRSWPVPDMTYNVFGGTLNLAQSIRSWSISLLLFMCSASKVTTSRRTQILLSPPMNEA